MSDDERAEFWKELRKLGDSSLALQRASEALRRVAESHEKRPDYLDVAERWLADKKRARETGEQV